MTRIIFVCLLLIFTTSCTRRSYNTPYDNRSQRQKNLDADRRSLQEAARIVEERGY